MNKKICRVSAMCILTFTFYSCGSTPKVQEYTPDSSEAVPITMPKRDRSFFSGVSPEALAAIENGSPDSIRYAYSILRSNASDYTEQEKILLNVAKAFFQILWTSETLNFEVPEVSTQNSYIGAIESARQGIYDLSTGNKDFLTILLPSLVLAISESRTDYYPQAQEALTEALKLNGSSVVANYLMGILCRRQGDYEAALRYFSVCRENSSEGIEILYALADCNYKLKRYEEAYSLAKAASDRNPYYKPALKICAETCFVLNRLDECEAYVGRVLQQEPENAYYVLFRARILIQKNDYIRAASLLDVYARSDTNSRDYLVLRAKVQKEWNKNISSAAQTIEKALELYPDDSEIILTAASLASESGNRIGGKSAGELAAVILEKDSQNISAQQIRINDLMQKKQWNEAYKVSTALRQNKNAPASSVYTHISICLASDRKEEAWNLASSLYSKKSDDETVVQNYVKVLVATGRTGEAGRIINQQIENNCSSKMKSFLLYEHSFIVSGEEAVLADLRNSLTANPRNKDALYRLYQIYYNKKEYRKAQYYLKQVVALSPADETLLKLNAELETLLSK